MNLSKDNVFLGLMLSDAHIRKIRTMTGKSSLEIKQTAKRKAFLEAIQDHFEKIKLSSKITPEYVANKKYPQNMLFTPSIIEIGNERKRWYPNGIKIVPRDLKLNGEILAWWIMGDGSSERTGKDNNSIKVTLYTNSFTIGDIEFLRNQLKELGIENTTHMKKGDEPVIVISNASSVQKLMDMIKPYIIPCFQYKIKEPTLIDFGNQVEKQRTRQLEYYHSLSPEEKKQRNYNNRQNVKDKRNPERKDKYHSNSKYRQECIDRANRNYKPHPRIRENLEPCHYCKSENVRKSGKIINKSGIYQRFRCNLCQKLYHSENKIESQ